MIAQLKFAFSNEFQDLKKIIAIQQEFATKGKEIETIVLMEDGYQVTTNCYKANFLMFYVATPSATQSKFFGSQLSELFVLQTGPLPLYFPQTIECPKKILYQLQGWLGGKSIHQSSCPFVLLVQLRIARLEDLHMRDI